MQPFKCNIRNSYAVANIWVDDTQLFSKLHKALQNTCPVGVQDKSCEEFDRIYESKCWIPGVFSLPNFGKVGEYPELDLFTIGLTQHKNILSLYYICADLDVTGEWFCQWLANALNVKIAWRYYGSGINCFAKIIVPDREVTEYKLKDFTS